MRHSYTYFEMTPKEKVRMFRLRQQGLSFEKIGRKLKRHPTSIYYWFNSVYRLKKIKRINDRGGPKEKDMSIESIRKKRNNLRIWRKNNP